MRVLGLLIIVIAGLVVGLGVYEFVAYSAVRGLISGRGGVDSKYLMGMFWAGFFLFLIIIAPIQPAVRINLMALWILRCFVTLGFMLFYEYHYVTLDAFFYYQYGRAGMYEQSELFISGTATIMTIVHALTSYLPLSDSYHALKVIWSVFGFVGSYLFWLSYCHITKTRNLSVLWLLCAFPSLLFWSSILGKDPLVFFGLGLATYGAVLLFDKVERGPLLMFAAGVLAVASIRVWTATALLFAMALCVVSINTKKTHAITIAKVIVWCSLMYFAGKMANKFEIASQADLFERVNVVSRGWSIGGSQQEVPELKTLDQVLRFLPRGMFTALYRPLPGEVNNIFGAVAGLENLALIFVSLLALIWARVKFIADKSVQFCILTIFIWSLLYAFISYQNLGSAVRFKIQILPYMLLVPMIFRHKKMQHRI